MGTIWSSETAETHINENGKRPRSEEENDASAFLTSTEIQQRRTKRQRVISPGSSLFSKTSISNKITVWLAQAFLSFAEYTAKTAPSSKELLEDDDFMESICHVLDCFQSSEPDILTRGWRMLCACTIRNDVIVSDHLTTIPDTDVASVIAGMNLHGSSMRLQLLGCRALRILLNKELTTWKQLMEKGVVPVLLQALDKFPNDLVLQGLMITFLGMLIKETGDDGRHQLLQGGAVEIILQAMRLFEGEDRLLYTGCYALHQLGYQSQARTKILETGGALVLLNILQSHISDNGLVDICLHALSKLTTVDASELDTWQWSSLRIVPTILDCMEKHPLDQSIQRNCLVCLLRLIGRVSVPPYRAILLILAAMKTFRQCANFLFFACATLREIVDQSREQYDTVQYLTEQEGAIDSILNAIQYHEGAFGLRSIVILLLTEILTHQQEIATPTAFGGGRHAIAVVAGVEMDIDALDVVD
jgi:hypothetical protein